MLELNHFTSTPIYRKYQYEEVINGVTILFNRVNGFQEGSAKAIFPTHMVKFNYVRGIKQGSAIKFFPDLTRIQFTYLNDIEIGRAKIFYADGTDEEFNI